MTAPYEAVRPTRVLTAVSADGTCLNVEEYGRADAPTVVLSHGWTCSTLFWAPIVRALAADFRLVAYDQRGHGRSAAPADRGGYSTRALADDLEAVLDKALPRGERALLVGHSMGGMTIMAAAGRPSVRARTAAVLLASTGSSGLLGNTRVLPPRWGARWFRRAFHRRLLVSRLPLGPVTPVARAALKYGVMSPGSTPEQVAFAARIVHACPARRRSAWGRVLAVLDLDAELAALTAPTAVLVGDADKLTPAAHAHRIAAALPHCVALTELPGRGHMTPIEDVPAVEAAIRTLAADHLTAHHLTADQPVRSGSADASPARPAARQPQTADRTVERTTSGPVAADGEQEKDT